MTYLRSIPWVALGIYESRVAASAASAACAVPGESGALPFATHASHVCAPAASIACDKPSKPRVAIVACLDSPNPHIGELEEYRKLFEDEGCACSVFDARELTFDGERLVGRRFSG
ncbi:MAG: hypothetical protein IKL97_06335 [Eggerthellaceae bacterium]|nr:hypothetical protein [Eggerthellaceae bacterium]